MEKIITIRIPDELDIELIRISKEQDRPVSSLVRDSLKQYIKIYRFRRLREKLMPFAEALFIITDEDIYKKI
ncbi:MAG: CopG family transcriptional regulator [Actinobacteria bacterium]|nr:CopG family transcriptional regulator [Actinomycetota bacterium]